MLMLETILVIAAIVLSAVILHEYAHGWAAYRLGDTTAKDAGRLTLNPIKHIDPVGTLLIPGILILLRMNGINTFVFGWAKPVPVNVMRLRKPKRDMMFVAIAGPAINIFLAVVLSEVLKAPLLDRHSELVHLAIFVNLLLAFFNLVPIPPLDGSRILMGLLPTNLAKPYARLEPYGMLILFGLLYLGIFEKVVLPCVIFFGSLLGVQF
jgi:Zn-dependent protease